MRDRARARHRPGRNGPGDHACALPGAGVRHRRGAADHRVLRTLSRGDRIGVGRVWITGRDRSRLLRDGGIFRPHHLARAARQGQPRRAQAVFPSRVCLYDNRVRLHLSVLDGPFVPGVAFRRSIFRALRRFGRPYAPDHPDARRQPRRRGVPDSGQQPCAVRQCQGAGAVGAFRRNLARCVGAGGRRPFAYHSISRVVPARPRIPRNGRADRSDARGRLAVSMHHSVLRSRQLSSGQEAGMVAGARVDQRRNQHRLYLADDGGLGNAGDRSVLPGFGNLRDGGRHDADSLRVFVAVSAGATGTDAAGQRVDGRRSAGAGNNIAGAGISRRSSCSQRVACWSMRWPPLA